jgi:hypothetical protein
LSQQNPSCKEVGFVDFEEIVDIIYFFGKAGW